MDLSKLKLEKFKNIMLVNFPDSIDLGITSTDSNPEVIIYFVDNMEDIEKFVSFCKSTTLPKENRTIMIYKKGRNDLNRDSIISPFKEGKYPNFKLKAPMLCSISKELSAFVLTKID
jgi:hypothetical protein